MGTISDEVVRAAPLLQRPRRYDPVKIVEARAAGITVARARELGAAVELRYVEAPIDVLFERLQRRGAEAPPITREQLVRFATLFMVPSDDEMILYDQPEE